MAESRSAADVEGSIREFYETAGWTTDSAGRTLDERLFTDPRPAAARYAAATRRRIRDYLPRRGELFLDAGSGPVQTAEYLEYSSGFARHVCVDISRRALEGARARLGDRGEYVEASLLDLPFPDDTFDAAASLHVIYHIEADRQEQAVRELIRVVKPGAPIVIAYTHDPLAPVRRLVRRVPGALALKRRIRPAAGGPELYVHAHPLRWWDRFRDSCSVRLVPLATLRADISRRFIPDSAAGPAFGALAAFERRLPALALRAGWYPLVVLVPRADRASVNPTGSAEAASFGDPS